MGKRKDRRTIKAPLTDSERVFCRLVVNGVPKAEAARRAGYADHRETGYALSIRPRVRAHIDKLQEKLDERSVVTAAELIAQQWALCQLNTADLYYPDGTIKPPSEWGELGKLVKKIKRDPETGEIIEIETWSKDSCWDRMNKIMGAYERDNRKVLEIRGGGNTGGELTAADVKQLSTDELRAIVARGRESVSDAEYTERKADAESK